ncbi:hypothetical protein VTJ04DRAFT_2163 [Mycothermus thermophilus]|uniref:uncharacterized protein n=1 Tax=Humicola insolens TaxID=85995 RepID=UPI00374342C0
MASSSSKADDTQDIKPLVNKPDSKLPPIPKGARIHKRPLPVPATTTRIRRNAPTPSLTAADPDGYTPPPRASHTVVIKVSSGAAFMSLVRRVRKALEKAPRRQATRGLPLAARMAALKVVRQPMPGGGEEPIQDALDDVVLVATGKAIARAVEVAGFFTREKDLAVLLRTRSVRAVDDVVAADDDADVEDQVRVRGLSCVEVGIRWLA